MIILQKLKWSNCFSYGENNELNLDNTTLTQIIGTNGMGKSSIPLIIEEALYNKNSKGIKKADIPNRYVNKGYEIELTFSKENDKYIIYIVRKSNIKVTLIKNGDDISSHTSTNTYKTLQNILGVDFKTFSQLVYQNTNASLQFLTATDANRKKFLIDLLHLDNYVSLFEIFKEEHRQASIKSNTASAQLSTVEKWLETNILEDTNILPMLELQNNTLKDEKLSSSLMAKITNISENNNKIIKNNQYKKMLQAIDISSLQSSSAKAKQDYDPLVQEYGEAKALATGSENTLKKLKGLGNICPTCAQGIKYDFKQSMISEAATKASIAKERISELKRRIESIKTENRKFDSIQKDIREWENLYNLYEDDMSDTCMDKDQLESELEIVLARIQKRKDELGSIAQENQRRTKINTRIQVITEQRDEFEKDKKSYTNVLNINSKKESSLEILKKAFSTNGLIAYKIETLVKELEELTNRYLGELSDGRFTLSFIVTNDKLNVRITDNGNIVDILALSSGELARVNTATLIAIRKLMSSISKSKINILFLDEVINVLDDQGREKMVEVLLQEDDLNTYIVSHGWTHPLLEKVEVVKDGNVSRLEW
jgi:DNA repair exonuclease SbcCD ATPase subunit